MIYRICTICDLYSFSFGSFAAFCPIIFTFAVDSVEKRICLKEISRGRMIFHISKKEGWKEEREKISPFVKISFGFYGASPDFTRFVTGTTADDEGGSTMI